ncbi:MAG: MBL fold metallo-hydrolase [Bacteroidia bacterium]
MIHTLDLEFQVPQAIAAFVIETTEGPVLVETGPHSVLPRLSAELKNLGYELGDIKHVFLTHIHFDHAGAAWALAQAGAKIYVHPRGYKHLLDPSRLYGSAKRIYGDMMETLWGLMEPIPADQLEAVEDEREIQVGEHTFKALHTPGHASHHIAWQLGEIIFAGDVAGCKIDGGPVVPPCPPPDINIEQWVDSINILRAQQPKQLYLTHFGPIDTVTTHLDELEAMLHDWANWIKPHYEAGKKPEEVVSEFQAYANQQLMAAGLDEQGAARYEAANPSYMSVAGLMRYWHKKE